MVNSLWVCGWGEARWGAREVRNDGNLGGNGRGGEKL